MKKIITICRIAIVSVVCASLFQSCLKDTATKTYTLFTPVYRSVADVRAGIKSDGPQPIIKPGKIFVLGNYIFLNEIDKGVHIIDNTNPSSPVNKYFISIPGNLDLAVKGKTFYADLYKDLVTIDISDPAAVQVKKITENVFPARQYSNFFIQDTTRVIVDWIKKDTTVSADGQPAFYSRPEILWYDLAAVSSSSVTPSTKGISGSMARFTLLNNYLYTVTNTGLNVFNISQPENPVSTDQQNVGWQIETIFPFKNNLFIGSQSGVFIFSTANPAHPVMRSMFGHITMCDPVIADDNFAYVTLHDGTTCHGTVNELDVLDISDINIPRLLASYPLTSPHGLSKSGNTLFICDGPAGLKVFDASDVNDLKLLQTVTGLNANDIITINNNAIVVATDGLYQYDYSNSSHITMRSKITYKTL